MSRTLNPVGKAYSRMGPTRRKSPLNMSNKRAASVCFWVDLSRVMTTDWHLIEIRTLAAIYVSSRQVYQMHRPGGDNF